MVTVNKEACIGCGACVGVCPASYEMTADGKAVVKNDSDCAEAGKNACPVNAIQ